LFADWLLMSPVLRLPDTAAPAVHEAPRRHFITWDRPLLPQAVAWLARDWHPGRGPLDLSDTLAIVPTRQSGRRLREALAELAAGQGHAVFPPVVLLPEELAQPSAAPGSNASRLESQLAWAGVLREIDLDEFREVFPLDPPARTFSWAARLAKQFQQLQKTLAENSLRFADVPRRGGADTPEAARWAQLAQLEALYDVALGQRGWRDPQSARISAARDPAVPRGVRRIVLLATPDPLPIAIDVLESHSRRMPVEVVIFAPPRLAELFDAWGRPRSEAWAERPLVLEDFEERVRLCADPSDQAARAVAAVKAYGQPEGRLALGLADPEVAPALENRLREAGFAPFNPEGRPRRRDGFFALLSALAAVVREPDFDAVATLARCPDFLAWLEARVDDRMFSAASALLALDELHGRHLPATLAAARLAAAESNRSEIQAAGPLLAAVAQLRAVLTQDVFPANAAAALATLFGARSISSEDPVAESAAAWMDILRAGRAASNFSGLTAAEWWELAVDAFAEQSSTDDRPAGAVELLGWLELLWEDAPHLLVAGCNDGCVPDAVVGDAFLPESLRARLGLKTNSGRFARDAYLLSALDACRTQAGRLDLLVGKASQAGDPLRPSRLLLRCADSELPRRIAFLFHAVAVERPSPPWQRAWPLVPPVDAVISALSVTAFADYLQCPFRFYLRHGLGMESVDPEKTELDAMDFGTLVHAALEQLGREEKLRDCTDPRLLGNFCRRRSTRRPAGGTEPS
jgi:ATP-dependent helicase/nuclease subunit B